MHFSRAHALSLWIGVLLAGPLHSANAEKGTISATPKGVKVDFGSMGAFTLGLPTLTLAE